MLRLSVALTLSFTAAAAPVTFHKDVLPILQKNCQGRHRAGDFWGDQTWEEMLAGFLDLSFDVNMNPADLVRPRPAASLD